MTTILAANQYYEIYKKTWKNYPDAEEQTEYCLYDLSDDIVYSCNTLDGLYDFFGETGKGFNLPKLNTVSASIILELKTELNRIYRDTTDDMIRINFNTLNSAMFQEPLKVSVNWSCIGAADPETTLKFATQLQAAANYAANEFPYKGLIVVHDN